MNNENRISGEKIYCQGHKISKKRRVLSKDGHHEDSIIVWHGFCHVEKPFRWRR